MEANTCPACGKPIAIGDINIAEGVGLCRACGKLSKLRDITEQPAIDPQVLTMPPPGCSYEPQMGGGAVIRSSLRSVGGAAGALAICLFWNGIVSVFVLIAVSGLYTHFVGPLPTWFPTPTSSGKPGNLNSDMSLGMTFFLCIFLSPFVLVGSAMFMLFLTCLMGRVEVRVTGSDGRVRTGFGPFNWTRRFDASRVKRVAIGQTAYQQNGQSKPLIRIEADRTVKFGSMLPDEQREWLVGALNLLLVVRAKGGRPLVGSCA